MSTVRIDHRVHLVGFDELLIVLRVKGGIQREGGATQINADVICEVYQRRQGLWQHDGIVVIDGFNGEGANHQASVFHNGQGFVALLVLMAGVADAWAPFFTTVLEPSPWSTEMSS